MSSTAGSGVSGAGGATAGGSTAGGADSMSGITTLPSSAGRSGGRSGRGGRGGCFGGRRQPSHAPSTKKFTGKSAALEGHVYDLTTPTATAAAFYDTIMEIAELVGRTYGKGNHTKLEIETLTAQNVTRPTLPMQPDGTTPSTDAVDLAIFKQEVASYVKGTDKIKENRQNAFSLIWGQCSDTLRAKVEASVDLAALNQAANVIGLLQAIRSVMLQFQTRKYQPLAILESKRRAMTFRQGDKSAEEYYRLFKQKVEATEHNGGSFGYETSLLQAALPTGTTMEQATIDEVNAAMKIVREWTLATMFLSNSDQGRYSDLLIDLENEFTRGDDNYPKTLADAYARLDGYHCKSRSRPNNMGGTMTGEVSFATDGEEVVPGTNGRTVDQREAQDPKALDPTRQLQHGQHLLQQEAAQEYPQEQQQHEGSMQRWASDNKPDRRPSRIPGASLVL
ncbi:hypothetical protein SEMRO_336_G120260.1 [Seminavis robusta]|uniref:Uncharacterized protein n=1 Tax=Seminavis robusta TaxID=568900 RepID=A0A9N8HDB3_9STRA|nr:hypothetical protein SEMRO_336_G120260.1 [Seminavis robusta]|eukprot:Sro336_g120260.1 n/a (450) ;mRNA; f:11518-13028